MKQWWKARSQKAKVWLVSSAVIAVLAVAGSAAPDDKKAPVVADTTQTQTTTVVVTQLSPTPTPTPTRATLSASDFKAFLDGGSDVADAMGVFSQATIACADLILDDPGCLNRGVAEFTSPVYDSMKVTEKMIDRVDDGACKARLKGYNTALVTMWGNSNKLGELVEAGRLDELTGQAEKATASTKRFAPAYGAALKACKP